jgi:hypothetical protein
MIPVEVMSNTRNMVTLVFKQKVFLELVVTQALKFKVALYTHLELECLC